MFRAWGLGVQGFKGSGVERLGFKSHWDTFFCANGRGAPKLYTLKL